MKLIAVRKVRKAGGKRDGPYALILLPEKARSLLDVTFNEHVALYDGEDGTIILKKVADDIPDGGPK